MRRERMHMRGDCFLALDAGGTSTRALVFHPTEGVVGEGYAGPGNIWAVGLEEALRAFEYAIANALGEAGLHPGELRGACFGVAGLHGSREGFRLRDALAPFAFPDPLLLCNDLEIAHAGGLSGREGVHLVAGTGSAAWGRNSEGAVARAGGWGWRIDDPGSAYWLGRRALQAVIEAEDGRGAPTLLTEQIFDTWHLVDVGEILDRIEEAEQARSSIAQLAQCVMRAAEADDAVAGAIVSRGAEELARLARAVVRRLGMDATGEPPEISYSGGTLVNDLYAKALRQSVETLLGTETRLHAAEFSPLAGAVLLAMGEHSLTAEADALRQLKLK